ncbi:valine--tRNA ligase [Candidatus Pacearchaeota archaeon]|nr:valine--tRNA ligase [Candidatus Pacearchaeota archaeon]
MPLKNIKTWSVEIENQITEKWKKSNQFKFNEKTKKKIYSIDTPPPYINAPIHIGHATTYAYQDFFARYRRMKGFEVLFPLGLDRNGLPIELGAEKKFKISPFKISRKEFLKYCQKLLEETSLASTDTFAKLGISFNSYKKTEELGSVYFTDDDEYRKLTQATFIDLFKKGLVYEDKRINNWDSKLQTTIADSEIDYEERESWFNDIKWKIKETDEEIIIGTTRPELICTCGMVIFNPEDKRYQHLEGRTAISPLFRKEIPIKSHPFAQIDKGTGLAMMCSAGDLTDIQFFREVGLIPIIAIDKNGKMNENAGFLKGLKVKEAREKIIEKLKEKSLLIKQEKIMHKTPISERSKIEVEFIEMDEYYVKQLETKEKIKELAKKMNFVPDFSRKILEDWIDSISIDWPVSRRRFYATEVPLWSCIDKKDGIKIYAVPKKGKYYQPWDRAVPKDAEIYKQGEKIGNISDENFKNKNWEGDTRVFDTWFDSSISVLKILNYTSDKNFFKKAYPCSLRPQGKEIVRTWLYYSLLRCYYETNKMPFEDVWIHNHILDGKGIKMSKSLGNVIDPQDIIKEFGAEAFRLWAAEEGNLAKQDLMCSKERIKGELKTLNKLLNISKFVMLFDKPFKKINLTKFDKLFIEYIENLTSEIDEGYWNYDFHNPSLRLRNFLWDIFASNYIEIIKSRAYNNENKFSEQESDSAKYTLHFLLERLLVLLYPIIPQITSTIAEEKNIDLLEIEFPKTRKITSDLNLVQKIIDFNSKVWKRKKDSGISLRNKISGIKIPEELKEFEKDLIACHNLV